MVHDQYPQGGGNHSPDGGTYPCRPNVNRPAAPALLGVSPLGECRSIPDQYHKSENAIENLNCREGGKDCLALVIIPLVLGGIHSIQGPQDGHHRHDEGQNPAPLEAQKHPQSGQHCHDTLQHQRATDARGLPDNPTDRSKSPRAAAHPVVPRKIAEGTQRNLGASPEHGGQADYRDRDTRISFRCHCGAPVTIGMVVQGVASVLLDSRNTATPPTTSRTPITRWSVTERLSIPMRP